MPKNPPRIESLPQRHYKVIRGDVVMYVAVEDLSPLERAMIAGDLRAAGPAYCRHAETLETSPLDDLRKMTLRFVAADQNVVVDFW